jgi:clathrin heavy chain
MFYWQEQPTLLNDLLTVLIPQIDRSRVVRTFCQTDHIPLIRTYFIAVQREWLEPRCSFNQVQQNSQQFNIEAFDNAYNDLLIEEEDYKILRDSVNSFEHSDDIGASNSLIERTGPRFQRLRIYAVKWQLSVT